MTVLTRRTLDRVRAPLREVGLNTVAFGLIIAVQQLIVFPGIARQTSAAEFSQVILFITVSTILSNVLGNEASKVSLIRAEAYRRRGLPWDSPRIAAAGSVAVLLAAVALLGLASLPPQLVLPYGAITVLAIVRTILTTPDKSVGAFHRVVIVHGVYAAGAVPGLLLVASTGSLALPFLLGETLSVLAVLVVRLRHREVPLTLRRTAESPATLRAFTSLALIALLLNAVTYIDRLTITPLLGASALAVYYSATALSSSLSLITNPGGNAMLARLGRMSDEARARAYSRGLMLAAPLVLVFWVASLIIALGGLALLYPSHLEAALPLLLPVSLAAAFSNSVSLLSPLLQRFQPLNRLLLFYAVFAVVDLAAILVLSSLFGLVGFAWASTIANSVLLVLYLVQIRRGARALASAS